MSSTANVRTKSLKLKLLPAGEDGAKDQVIKSTNLSETVVYYQSKFITNPNFRLMELGMQNMGDQHLKSVKIILT